MTPADRAPPGGQDPGAGAAPARLPAADLLWARGLAEAPGGFVDYARFPFVARRREGAARAGLRGALLEPRGARGVPGLSLSRPRTRRERSRHGVSGRRMSRRPRRWCRSGARPRRDGVGAETRELDAAARRRELASSSGAERRGERGGRGPAGGAGARCEAGAAGSAGRTWPRWSARSTSPGIRRRSTSSATTRVRGDAAAASSSSSTRCGGAWRPRASSTCPATGRGLIVANHSGVLPWDGLMVQARDPPRAPGAARLPHAGARHVRAPAVPGAAARARAARCARTPRTPSACCARASWSASSPKA